MQARTISRARPTSCDHCSPEVKRAIKRAFHRLFLRTRVCVRSMLPVRRDQKNTSRAGAWIIRKVL